jgi:hypothetical protein
MVFKHGLVTDGDDHINFHMEQDDQTVYFHGDINASGSIMTEQSASIGTTRSDGMFQVDYGNSTAMTGSLTSIGDGYGDIISAFDVAGTDSIPEGAIVSLNSIGSGTQWYNCSCHGVERKNMLGVVLVEARNKVLTKGFVKLTQLTGSAPTSEGNGQPIYLSPNTDGSGSLESGSYSSGNIARIIGYGIDVQNNIIYFNPDNTWVEVD